MVEIFNILWRTSLTRSRLQRNDQVEIYPSQRLFGLIADDIVVGMVS